LLDRRLTALAQAALVMRQVAWNSTGPDAESLRRHIEDEVDALWPMIDAIADRLVAVGGTPSDSPEHLVGSGGVADEPVAGPGRVEGIHLVEAILSGLVAGHRRACVELRSMDPRSAELLSSQSRGLESSRWVLAHWAGPRDAKVSAEDTLEAVRRRAGLL
jgi:DNA-binding ferritin-like protein